MRNFRTQKDGMALARDSRNKVIGGVCAGVARRLGADPWLVRLLFIVSLALPGPGILVYLVLWAVLPLDRDLPRPLEGDEGGTRFA